MFRYSRLRAALALSGLVAGHAAASELEFANLAEGYTSESRNAGIVAAQRMFSVPDFPGICAPLPAPVRLVVMAPDPVTLVRDEWFSYDRLVVVAVDVSDTVLPPVPITVEVEQVAPPVLNLRSDFTADPNGKVLAVRPGRFHFRFRTICEGHSAVVIVPAEVTEP